MKVVKALALVVLLSVASSLSGCGPKPIETLVSPARLISVTLIHRGTEEEIDPLANSLITLYYTGELIFEFDRDLHLTGNQFKRFSIDRDLPHILRAWPGNYDDYTVELKTYMKDGRDELFLDQDYMFSFKFASAHNLLHYPQVAIGHAYEQTLMPNEPVVVRMSQPHPRDLIESAVAETFSQAPYSGWGELDWLDDATFVFRVRDHGQEIVRLETTGLNNKYGVPELSLEFHLVLPQQLKVLDLSIGAESQSEFHIPISMAGSYGMSDDYTKLWVVRRCDNSGAGYHELRAYAFDLHSGEIVEDSSKGYSGGRVQNVASREWGERNEALRLFSSLGRSNHPHILSVSPSGLFLAGYGEGQEHPWQVVVGDLATRQVKDYAVQSYDPTPLAGDWWSHDMHWSPCETKLIYTACTADSSSTAWVDPGPYPRNVYLLDTKTGTERLVMEKARIASASPFAEQLILQTATGMFLVDYQGNSTVLPSVSGRLHVGPWLGKDRIILNNYSLGLYRDSACLIYDASNDTLTPLASGTAVDYDAGTNRVFIIDRREIPYTSHFQSQRVASNEPPETVAKQLLTMYLEHHMREEIPQSARLQDFKISEIHIDRMTLDGFVFAAEFSVQGWQDGYWEAGNGLSGQDNWVYNKYMFITVKQDGSNYRWLSWATSP